MIGLSTVILPVALFLNVDAAALEYGSAKDDGTMFGRIGTSRIPRLFDEKLVLQQLPPGKEGRADCDTLVVMVNENYDRTKKEILSIVGQRFGVAEEQNGEDSLIPGKPLEREPYLGWDHPWPGLGAGLSALLSDRGRAREYEITTKPYHILDDEKGFSQLRIRISDGMALFGGNITILQLRRRDFSWEWASYHPLVFPWKTPRAHTLVTNTEVELVEELKKRNAKLATRYFAPNRPKLELVDPAYIAELLGKMKEAVQQIALPSAG